MQVTMPPNSVYEKRIGSELGNTLTAIPSLMDLSNPRVGLVNRSIPIATAQYCQADQRPFLAVPPLKPALHEREDAPCTPQTLSPDLDVSCSGSKRVFPVREPADQ